MVTFRTAVRTMQIRKRVRVTFTVANVTITTSSLPSGTVGQPYSVQLTSVNGVGPFSWSVPGLPSGLSCSTGGLISGTPSVTFDQNMTVSITDNGASGYTTQVDLGLEIVAAATGLLSSSDFTFLGAFRVPTSAGGVQAIGNPDNGGGLALRRVSGQVRLFTWTDASGGSGRVYEMTPPADIGTAVGTRPIDGPNYTQATLVRDWGDITGGRSFHKYNDGWVKTGTVTAATATTITFSIDVTSTVVGKYVGVSSGPRAGRAVKIASYNSSTKVGTLAAGHTWASTPQAGDPFTAAHWKDSPVERHGLTWIEASQRLYWSYGIAYGGASDSPCLGFSTLDDGSGVATAYGPFGRFGQYGQGGITEIPSSWSATYASGKTLMVGNGGYYSTFVGSIGCAMRACAEPALAQQDIDYSLASDGIASVSNVIGMSWPASSTVRGPRNTNYENGNIFIGGNRCHMTARDGSAHGLQGPEQLVPSISPWTGVVASGSNKANTTSGSNTVTLTTTTDISAVATNGTVPLWIAESTSSTSMMNCSPITGISGTSGNWTVTTRDTWPTTGTGLGMAVGGNPNSSAYPTYAPPLWGFKATSNGTSSVAVTYSGTLSTASHAGRCLWVGTGSAGTKRIITSVSGSAPNWTVTCSGTFASATDVAWAIGNSAAGLRVLMTSGAASGESRKVLAWVANDPQSRVRNSFVFDSDWAATPGADTYTLYRDSVVAATSTTVTLGTGEATTLADATQVEICSGTGAGQVREITAWDGTNKVATVATWTTTPDTTSKYNLVTRGTTAGQVAIDHSGGFGRWTWGDYLPGNSCVWINGPSKRGVVYFPSLATGCLSYWEAFIIMEGHQVAGMIFNPDDLGSAVLGNIATTDPLPVSQWVLSTSLPEFHDDDSPDPRTSNGYCYGRGHQTVGAAYDSVDKRLYVLMQRGWTSGGSSRPTVYVFSVNA